MRCSRAFVEKPACLTPCLRLRRAIGEGVSVGLVVDGLTAEERDLVNSFAIRAPQLTPQSRALVATSIAKRLRSRVEGASAYAIDAELVNAVAAALKTGNPPASTTDRDGHPDDGVSGAQDVAGRRYVLSRLADLVRAGALDEPSAERVRALIEGELASIAAVPRASMQIPQSVTEPGAVEHAPSEVGPSGPTPLDLLAAATRTFATEETPSLLLYIGAFLVVVAAFIFVSVSGDQISDLVKLVLMIVGTTGFLAAGIVCHRYPRVLPAGRTFLVIGALITPLDSVAYYVLVARVSPLDAPTIWTLGSLVSAALYAALRLGGYGIGYSYLFYAAVLSAVLGVEALVKLPVSWAAVPIAAMALVFERLRMSTTQLAATVVGPLARMTVAIAALAGAALAIPIAASTPGERAALPIEILLLTGYYFLRASRGPIWEQTLATGGPGLAVVAAVYSAGADLALVALASVLVGSAYVTHEIARSIDRALNRLAPWAQPRLTTLGLAFLLAGLLPLGAFARTPAIGAAAFLLAGLAFTALSLVWDERSGSFAAVPGEYVLIPAAAAIAVGYRFALGATGSLPLAQNGIVDLARAYAPFSVAAWLAVAPLLRSRLHARIAAALAALLSVFVSVGSLPDAPVHTGVNALYAVAGAAIGVRMASRRTLWIAAAAAMLCAYGAYRWSGLPPVFAPLVALVPAVGAFGAGYLPKTRPIRTTFLQIATASSVVAAGIGLALDTSRAPWDADVWRTAMLAIALAGTSGGVIARLARSQEIGLAAALSLPVLVDMAVLTAHPTLPEELSAAFAAYAFVAAWVTRRSTLTVLASLSQPSAYVASALAIFPTALRVADFATLFASLAIAFALIGVAAWWRSPAIERVALLALVWISFTRIFVDPRIDDIRIGAGALLLAACVASVRLPRVIRLPEIAPAELVAAALIVVPTAVVTVLDPGADHFDLPIPLLLCIELGALYGVAVVYQRVALLRAATAVSCVAAIEFLALASYGEWYAALLGSAMINAALAIARRWPQGRTLREHAVLGALGVGVLFLPSLGDSITHPSLTATAEVVAAGLGVLVAAGVLGERWITAAALAVLAIESIVIVRLPEQLQFPGVAAGAILFALAIAFPRFRRGGLPAVFSTAFEALGIWLFLMPTFLLTFTATAAVQHAILMTQLVVLTLAGLGFRRRWQIIPAIGMIGIEAVRGVFEVVNRIPSFATFAIAGALLLAIGFLLLLKREAFERWRQTLTRWWVAWLAASS
jgi:hypothetical protein